MVHFFEAYQSGIWASTESIGRVQNWEWIHGLKSVTDPVILMVVAAVVHAALVTCCRRYRRHRDHRRSDNIRRRKRLDDDPREEVDEEHPLLPVRRMPSSPKPECSPPQRRIAWLDHAKFLAILMVNWNHCNEMFPHAALLGPRGRPSKAVMALCDMFGLSNMPIFFFCSGYVAKAEFSTTYLRAGAVTLLVPWFMFDTWNTFVSNPSFKWTEESFQLGEGFDLLFYIGHDLFENNVRLSPRASPWNAHCCSH
jgi:hypothetical protein